MPDSHGTLLRLGNVCAGILNFGAAVFFIASSFAWDLHDLSQWHQPGTFVAFVPGQFPY